MKPSYWFVVVVVLLLGLSLQLYSFLQIPAEEGISFAVGLPIPFWSEEWKPGYEQMHISATFSYAWLVIDTVAITSSAFLLAQVIGKKQ